MKTIRFSEEDTLKFAKLYRKHVCLWNVANPNYKIKGKRQNAVLSIIKEMGLPGFGIAEVKNKIKNLRSTFNQELTKIRRSQECGNGAVYTPSIKWFEILEPVMLSTESKEGRIEEEFPILVPEAQLEEVEGVWLGPPSPQQEMEEVNMLLEAHTLPAESGQEEEQTCPSGKRKMMDLSGAIKDLRTARDNLSISHTREPVQSETDIFGKYVAACLSGLSPTESILAQQEIQATLTKYRIAQLKNTGPSATEGGGEFSSQ